MKLKVKEVDIQRQICKYLELKRIPFWRNNNSGMFREGRHFSNRFGMKGLPDIFVLFGVFTLAIEVKSEKGRLSEDQKKFAEIWEGGQRKFFMVRSLEEVQNIIEGRVQL